MRRGADRENVCIKNILIFFLVGIEININFVFLVLGQQAVTESCGNG